MPLYGARLRQQRTYCVHPGLSNQQSMVSNPCSDRCKEKVSYKGPFTNDVMRRRRGVDQKGIKQLQKLNKFAKKHSKKFN